MSSLTNNAEFVRNYRAVLERARGNVATVAKKIIIDMTSRIILMSPVDTGRFRANWQMAAGAMNFMTDASVDKTGQATIERIRGIVEAADIGVIFYFTNSLPYARPLEYGLLGKPPGSANGPKSAGGYSSQAPAGMVRVTVAEFATHLKNVVAGAAA